MKLNLTALLIIISTITSSAQGEANIWYFGENAGLDFNSGSPVALTDGQLFTHEGCATISNANGELLFYTDGTTVYNRNHAIMVNGTGLLGHSSSALSATVVPKPGSNHLFYVFTTPEETNPNGFRYSIIDMNLDGGNGAITSEKNILVYTNTLECLGVTKHANGVDYWIITHGWNSNSFFAHQLSSSGLSFTPVVSDIGINVSGSPIDAISTIKVSQSGSKLVFASKKDIAQLFDFDNMTGVLSNELTLITHASGLYSSAFSPDESFLYITHSNPGKILQFNLNASNIPSSQITIHTGDTPGQMQVGPDNKIYIAFLFKTEIGVIHNPNELGLNCNFVLDGVDLAGKRSRMGLPSFNQSFFFTPSITVSSVCEQESSVFSFSSNQTVLSVVWNFGDGNTSNEMNPVHTYSSAGTYSVSVTVTTPNGVGTNSRNLVIFPKPVLTNSTVTLKQCDDDNDGFSAFNLSEAHGLMVASTENLSFSFFESLVDAQNNTNPIANFTAYVNQTVSTDQVFVRVSNEQDCFSVATLNLVISTTLIPASFQRDFTVCDDLSSGSIQDGIATFDFSSITPEISAFYPPGQQLVISYYENLADALAEQNAIVDISNHSNTASPNVQNIYIRVDSLLDNECLGLGHHITLFVEALPIIPSLNFTSCDDDQDGFVNFDVSSLETILLEGLPNVALTFWNEDGSFLPSPLSNPFFTNSQNVLVRATNITTNACFFETTIAFTVDDLPEVFPIPTQLTTFCDDETDPLMQNGLFAFDTSSFQDILVGNQTNVTVNYYNEAGQILASPLPNPLISGTQNITVILSNTTNSNCSTTATIPLRVHPTPRIELFDDELICSDNPSFTRILDAGFVNQASTAQFTFQWFLNGNTIVNQTSESLTVNEEGVYTVEVTHPNGCSKTRTITVNASNLATIDEVQVVDFSNENSVTIMVSGLGNYVYSLDNENFQESNFFPNLETGIYTVYVKDLLGCGTKSKIINVLGAPNFFTPNGDGHHDFWNIKGASRPLSSKIKIAIFDRFGKLLVSINPLTQGWDGTFQGQAMPSTDYWYVIEIDHRRVVKGHFSLIR